MSSTPLAHGLFFRIFRFLIVIVAVVVVSLAVLIAAVLIFPLSQSGQVNDEALLAGRTAESLPAADEDYFKDMDWRHPADQGRSQGQK